MSPIANISNIRRLPRLDMIRLGIKKEGDRGPYPQAVDYFVCPDEVKAIYGDKPTELDIMFPADDLELVAPQWYKCYSYSQGLICRGDGKKCWRKVDVHTGDFANRDTREWETAVGICEPEHCPMIGSKQCRRMMSLLFILPEVPRLGVYQLNTSSIYSIININSQLAPDGFIRPFTKGKISFIPLKLSIGSQVVTPPGVGRKIVQTLKLWADVKLADIIRISRQRPYQVLLPTVAEEEPPEDLYPGEVLEQAEETGDTAEKEWEALSQGSEADASPTPATPADMVKEGAAGAGAEVPKEKVSAAAEEKPPEEAIEGEGFQIDLTWLRESKKVLKWTDDTIKTFLVSNYKVSPEGTFTEVLQRLTREQAEDFVNEINRRVKRQPKLI